MSQSKKYREVYELYQLCSNGKDLKEFCIEAGVNYNKFTEWQHPATETLWSLECWWVWPAGQPQLYAGRQPVAAGD